MSCRVSRRLVVIRHAAVLSMVGVLLFATGPGALADPDTAPAAGAAGRRAVLAAEAEQATNAVTTAALSPVDSTAAGASALAAAAFDAGAGAASFAVVPPTNGTHALTAEFGNYTPSGQAALLTTGDASLADDPDDYQSSGRDAKGGIDRGERTYDVTVLKVDFTVPSGINCLQVNFRFYTEEYPEFSDATYDDAFIAELDSSSWDTAGTTITAPNNFATGAAGITVSSRNAAELGMSRSHATGTTYDAATPVYTARMPVTAGNHSLYLSIFDQYDSVYDSAVLLDRISAVARADCPRGFDSPQTPTIFVPGILGTKMYQAGDEIWPAWLRLADLHDTHLNRIKLRADGVTDLEDDVRTGDVVRSIPTYDIYGEMLDKLIDRGYVFDRDGRPARGESLFFHPTDWRRSVTWNATRLLDHIEQVRTATGASKVNLIAHSQGGLTVRQTLSLTGSYGRVNRVVTIGTPFLGTPQALTMLRYKKPCLMPQIAGQCPLNQNKVSEIGTNFPGYLELLPSPALWASAGSIVKSRNLVGAVTTYTHDEFVAQKMGDFNVPLLNNAADWHRGHDDWSPADPSVGLLRIVGTRLYTVTGLTEEQYLTCAPLPTGCREELRYVVNEPGSGAGNGDGLVLINSANPATHNGKGRTEFIHDRVDHDHLDSHDGALNLALGVFRGAGPLSAAEADAAASIAMANSGATIADEPAGLAGVEITVDGPAVGRFTDRDGWRTGAVGSSPDSSATDIPGSSYFPLPNRAVTFLADTQADGRWTATAAGEIRLLLRTWADDAITGTVAYPAAAVDAGAVLTVDALTAPLGTAPVLKVDDDGDGTVDRTITPLAPVTGMDTAEPLSTVTATPYTATNGSTRYQVTVTAADTGGAGVASIEWLNTSDGTYRFVPYTGPLDLPAGGTLYVRSTDRAGNVERNLPTVALS
ncbi:hypothetical protein Nm8I071_36690 [Nonomuraea sp. TT08I-71]|nr:hypothetical protein Nm8I071_36690 [Nonomuraea sp. TT08I-71]